MNKYPATVAAALSETDSKFALADALLREIPNDIARRGYARWGLVRTIDDCLADARQEIIDAGGEPKAIGTLGNYRKTAAWVQGRWIPGVSFNAHFVASTTSMSYEEWAKNPMTSRELRRLAAQRRAEREAIYSQSAAQTEALRAQMMEEFKPYTETVKVHRRGDPAIPFNVQVVFWATALENLIKHGRQAGYDLDKNAKEALRSLCWQLGD